MVGANVEQSYISLKPKVTLFKASMAQGVFQSMAIFLCVLPSAFWWLPGRYCNAMKYSSQISRKESNSRASAMEIMVFLMGFFPFCSAEIRHSEIRSDYHFIIPFEEFWFTHRGLLEIYVKDSSYKAIKENDIDLESMGFFLSTRDVWLHVLQDLEHG